MGTRSLDYIWWKLVEFDWSSSGISGSWIELDWSLSGIGRTCVELEFQQCAARITGGFAAGLKGLGLKVVMRMDDASCLGMNAKY